MVRQYNLRQVTEEKEERFSPHATKSKLSKGRPRPEEPCPIRTAFQRDRDRIIHCKAFRRLKHKTQVFIAPSGDHYVTRLTHTLEVSQIARTIARALNLNEDLTEAVALGHDLGHTPFGHVGEDALNELYRHGFRHNEQSLRVIDVLEKDGRGLNLTWEVRDGILNHSKPRVDIQGDKDENAITHEGEVCKIADAIAYINHDIDDAVRAGIVNRGDLPLSAVTVLGISRSQRINTMVSDIIDSSLLPGNYGIINNKLTINMSPLVLAATNTLRDYLFERVYNLWSAHEETEKAKEVIRLLYNYFIENEGKIPAEYQLLSSEHDRRVVDYIAGMTDQYAQRLAEDIRK